MGVVISQIQTITCDECGKSITFDVKDAQKTVQETPWMLTVRSVTRLDNQQFTFCSDSCNVTGIEKGECNIPEPKKLVDVPTGGSQAAIHMAAEAARKAEEATRVMKSGQGGKIEVVR